MTATTTQLENTPRRSWPWAQEWPVISSEVTVLNVPATTPVGLESQPNLYGQGFFSEATDSSLRFAGKSRWLTWEEPDEFEFDGYGMAWRTGSSPQLVKVSGRAIASPSEDDPRINSFLGQGFVHGATGPAGTYIDAFVAHGIVQPKRESRRPPRHRPSRAYRTFKELATWLSLSHEELAPIIGVGRTTPYNSWKQGAEPRPAVARKLYQLHAVVRALRAQLGQEGLADWLGHGSPYPLKCLIDGKQERFERLADEVIFSKADSQAARLDAAWGPEEPDGPPPSMTARPSSTKRSGLVRSRRLGR
jgi:hypothetical protein